MHPVEHDLRRPVPPRRHVARHLVLRGPGETKVEDAELALLVDGDVGRLQVLRKEVVSHCAGNILQMCVQIAVCIL